MSYRPVDVGETPEFRRDTYLRCDSEKAESDDGQCEGVPGQKNSWALSELDHLMTGPP